MADPAFFLPFLPLKIGFFSLSRDFFEKGLDVAAITR